jgi:putative phosphotransacetylase
MTYQAPLEISARHIHISEKDLDILFGHGYQITVAKKVSQPGQFSSQEMIELVGPKGSIKNVKIVGPVRLQTQVELSMTDARALGVKALLKVSGDLEASLGGLKLIGPEGEIELNRGIIIAKRHLHIQPELALEWGIKQGDVVKVKVNGERALIFDQVVVRSREGVDALAIHLDTDEANAAGIMGGEMGEIIINNNQ